MITESSLRTIEPDIQVIDIRGRLNLGNTLQTVESSILRLIAQGARKLIVNVEGLNFIDSAGIGMLIACNGQMEQKQGAMRIAGAHGPVAQTFELVHMSRICALDADVDTACRNFS